MPDIVTLAKQFYRSKVHPDTPEGVGYAPEKWIELSLFLIHRGIPEKELMQSDLVIFNGKKYYDRYRGKWLNLSLDGRIEPLKQFGGVAMWPTEASQEQEPESDWP